MNFTLDITLAEKFVLWIGLSHFFGVLLLFFTAKVCPHSSSQFNILFRMLIVLFAFNPGTGLVFRGVPQYISF